MPRDDLKMIDRISIMYEGKRFREGQGGHIEQFNRCEDGSISVTGWALCIADPQPDVPLKLFVFCGKECIYETSEFSQLRPDLATHFCNILQGNNEKLAAGFAFVLPPVDDLLLPSVEFYSLSKAGYLYRLEHPIARCNLQLELTGRCNMRCPQCPNMITGFHNQDLLVDESDLADSVLKRATTMCLDGFGEALLAKDFDAIVAKIPWIKRLSLHTNGMLLRKKKKLFLEYAPPFRRITVSLDALTPELYQIMRPGGDLNTILSSMRELIQERKERKQIYPEVVPNLTLSAQNVKELCKFIHLAKELDGILEITTLYDPAYSETKKKMQHESYYKNFLPRLNYKSIHQELCNAVVYAKKLGVSLAIVGYSDGELLSELIDDYGSLINKEPVCNCNMKTSATLQVDGKGMLCVWQTSPVFNWRDEGTMDPLQTKRGRKVVAMLNNNIIPAECGGSPCPFVARRPAEDSHPPVEGTFSGGWQKR